MDDVIILILFFFGVANAIVSFFLVNGLLTIQEPPPAPFYGR